MAVDVAPWVPFDDGLVQLGEEKEMKGRRLNGDEGSSSAAAGPPNFPPYYYYYDDDGAGVGI